MRTLSTVTASPGRLRPRTAITLLALAGLLAAQPGQASTGGPDSFGYVWSDQNEAGVDNSIPPRIGDPPVTIDVADGVMSSVYSLPRPFPFYGQSLTDFRVSPNGWITFDPAIVMAPAPDPLPVPESLPSLTLPTLTIAPLWLDVAPIPNFYLLQAVEGGSYFRFSARTRGGNELIQTHIVLFRSGAIKVWYEILPGAAISAAVAGLHGTNPPVTGEWLMPWSQGTGSNGFVLAEDSVLLYTPPPLLDCSAAEVLPCDGMPVMGISPSMLLTNVTSYLCSPNDYEGNEKVYTLDVPNISHVDIDLSNVAPFGIDLDVILLDAGACDELQCTDWGDSSISSNFLPPGQYKVVVDGIAPTDLGTFDITASCSTAGEQLNCGATAVPGMTLGASLWDLYPGCSAAPTNLTGAEFAYRVSFPGGNLRARLDNHPMGDVDLLVFRADNLDPMGCLTWGDEDIVLFDAPPGDYVILVDGKAGFSGTYDISVSCGTDLDCTAPQDTLTCETPTAGSTLLAVNTVDRYNCAVDPPLSGPEVVFDFAHPGGSVSFLMDGPPELQMLLVEDTCNEARCVATGNPLVTPNLPAGNYFLVVDSGGSRADFTITPVCQSRLVPDSLEVTMQVLECTPESKTVYLKPDLPTMQLDVLFMVDVTEQQAPFVPLFDAGFGAIIDEFVSTGADIQFGLASFGDYPNFYSSCAAYDEDYGFFPDDYPYRLNQPITSDRVALSNALATLLIGLGGDQPDAYSRALYESYTDPAIGWRPNAMRLVVMTGDDVPHECDPGACLGSTNNERGVDPGPDEIIGTADDLTIDIVMNGLAAQCMTPVRLQTEISLVPHDDLTPGTIKALWDCWATPAEGTTFNFTVGDNSNVPPFIRSHVESLLRGCKDLSLRASPGFGPWLQNVNPASRQGVLSPGITDFVLDICVPAATPGGNYGFEVELVCDCVAIASQSVTVNVNDCTYDPQVSETTTMQCAGLNRTLDGSASGIGLCPGVVEYQWLDELGVVVSPWGTANSVLNVTVDDDTVYTLQIRCSDQAVCPGFDEREIIVPVDPPAEAGPNQLTCAGGTVMLGDPAICDPSFTYSWTPTTDLDDPTSCTPNATPLVIPAPLPWTQYTVTVTNPATGCSRTDDVFVVVEGAGTAGLIGNNLRAYRGGDTVNLDWTPGALVPPNYNVHAASSKVELDRMNYLAPQLINVVTNTFADVGAVPPAPRGTLLFYDVWGRKCDGSSQLP